MRRHRFEPAALVMGLVLLGLATSFVLDVCGVWDLSDPHRNVTAASSGLLLVAATAVVTRVVRAARSRRARRRTRYP